MNAWSGLLRQPKFLEQCTRHLALPLRRAALDRHFRTREAHAGPIYDGTRDANIELRKHSEDFQSPLSRLSDVHDLRAYSKARARQTALAMNRNGSDTETAYAVGARIVERFHLKPPRPSRTRSVESCIQRMRCERWWRRKVRRYIVRHVETHARVLGMVHVKAAPYVSNYTLKLWRAQKARNNAILAECEAVNELDQRFALAELIEKSVANPTLRRHELMTRLAGTEQYANDHGYEALFVTLTAPGYMHAVHSRTHKVKPDGARRSPTKVHKEYLQKLWQQIRSALARRNIVFFGMRVAEPHHDGTPHWHLLIFVRPGKPLNELKRTLRHYAFKDAPNESGAEQHRLKIERIDPTKGTATGYVAKYLSKNIDGAHLDSGLIRGSDGEWIQSPETPAAQAERVIAWASTWGVRQFQFFGLPPVSVWRELRRLGLIHGHDEAEALRQAADSGDWCRYITLMGGPCVKRSQWPARLEQVETGKQGAYGEPLRKPLLRIGDTLYDARPHDWKIEHKPTVLPDEFFKTSPLHIHKENASGRSTPSGPFPFKGKPPLKGNPQDDHSFKIKAPTFGEQGEPRQPVAPPPIDAPFRTDDPPFTLIRPLQGAFAHLKAELRAKRWQSSAPLEFCQ